MTTFFNKKSLRVCLQAAFFALCSFNSYAAETTTGTTIDATISGYECGDNCYLTIIDSEDGEMTGLCIATLCEEWNMEAAMPEKYIGKKVRIVVGEGQQFDAAGNVMGTMEAFTNIELLN